MHPPGSLEIMKLDSEDVGPSSGRYHPHVPTQHRHGNIHGTKLDKLVQMWAMILLKSNKEVVNFYHDEVRKEGGSLFKSILESNGRNEFLIFGEFQSVDPQQKRNTCIQRMVDTVLMAVRFGKHLSISWILHCCQVARDMGHGQWTCSAVWQSKEWDPTKVWTVFWLDLAGWFR